MSGGTRVCIVEALNLEHKRAKRATERRTNSDQENLSEETEEQSHPEWASEMSVQGVVDTTIDAKAKELGWNMEAPSVGEGNEKFICVVPAM